MSHIGLESMLDVLERENNYQIILAVENGSRNWGLAGPHSDYDVRFIYHYSMREYLKLKRPREVFGGRLSGSNGEDIDYQGFDIYKFIELFLDSNPTIIEWLNSDIIYKERPSRLIEATRKASRENFNVFKLYKHYRSMGWNNFSKYILKNKNVTYKRYLYAFRGLFNAIYVYQYERLPDFRFERALRNADFIDRELKDFILEKAIPAKLTGLDKEEISRNTGIEILLHSLFDEYEGPSPDGKKIELPVDINDLIYEELLKIPE